MPQSVFATSVATSNLMDELHSALQESRDCWMTIEQFCLELGREVVQLSTLLA